MTGRRRPATRRTASIEPTNEPVARQTRRSARRPGATSIEPEVSQRGTQRRRHKSVESIPTSGSQNSSDEAANEPEDIVLPEISNPIMSQNGDISETDDLHESPEMEAAKIQDMIDFDIPKLTRWSSKMYDILSSIGINQPSVEDRSRLNGTRRSYNQALLPFTHDSALFIKPINLPGDYDAEVQASIQVAICSGNILSTLVNATDVALGKKRPLPLLEELDDAFLALFEQYSQIIDNIESVSDLAFRIRYRRLVEVLATESSIGPLESAARIFCDQPAHGLKGAREALGKGPYKQLAGAAVNQDAATRKSYQARIRDLVHKLSTDDTVKIRSLLDQDCPLESLFDDLRLWALQTYKHIHTPRNQSNASGVRPALGSHGRKERRDSESLFVDNNNINKDDEPGGDSDSDSDTDAAEYDQLPAQESNRSFINSSAALAAVRQSERQAAALSESALPDDLQRTRDNGGPMDTRDAIRRLDPELILNRTRKRPRLEENGGGVSNDGADNGIIDDDGDDFEVNEQLLGESSRAQNNITAIQKPSPRRPRFSKQPRTAGSQPPSPLMTGSRQHAGNQSPDDMHEDPNLHERDILVLSQEARNIRRANYANKPRQIRIPWSASDTSRLLDLIADPSLGCSWSAMEKAGGFESTRTQQSIRDKARTLKVWYLEGDRILPAGFDQVALGQKEKDAVIRCGRNPDRREDDLDEDGQVTNNIWSG